MTIPNKRFIGPQGGPYTNSAGPVPSGLEVALRTVSRHYARDGLCVVCGVEAPCEPYREADAWLDLARRESGAGSGG